MELVINLSGGVNGVIIIDIVNGGAAMECFAPRVDGCFLDRFEGGTTDASVFRDQIWNVIA